MKKYRLIGGSYAFHVKGEIYLEDYQHPRSVYSIKELVERNPDHWELIEDDFVLPEKWCIKSGDDLVVSYVNENGVNKGKYTKTECKNSYSHFPSYNNRITTSKEIKPGYREISLNQFKKYVLNMKEEKEIYGYNIKEEFSSFAKSLLSFNGRFGNSVADFGPEGEWYKILSSANVLDIWCTPVYKKATPKITINGYKGEFFDDYVKFGCAQIDKRVFVQLYKNFYEELNGNVCFSNKEIESITIGKGTFSKEQIKEIAQYYLNKDK